MQLNLVDSGEACFVRIYTTYWTYGQLQENKTLNFGELCWRIGHIREDRADPRGAVEFYREAIEHIQGQNNKEELETLIQQLQEAETG